VRFASASFVVVAGLFNGADRQFEAVLPGGEDVLDAGAIRARRALPRAMWRGMGLPLGFGR